MAAPASDWLRHFDSSSETAKRNSTKLDRREDLIVLYQVCVFRAHRKIKWRPWPLIGWDIFDSFSETAERNSMKLKRKQDLSVLYQVCVFSGRLENKMTAWHMIVWDIFDFSSETAEWNSNFNLTGSRNQCPLTSFCFSFQEVYKNGRLGWSVKKVTHCTQVHDMWLLGLLWSPSIPIRDNTITETCRPTPENL